MKNSSFELFLDDQDMSVKVEIPWKVVTYETSKGLEIFPDLESNSVKIPKRDEDDEIVNESDLETIVLSDVSYEINSPEVEGDRAVIIRPKSIWIDLETKKAVVVFELI